jgi:hypothetical protein
MRTALGHLRPIDDVSTMSAFAPIATKLLNYSSGRNGPMLSKKSSFWLVVGLITLGRSSRFWL